MIKVLSGFTHCEPRIKYCLVSFLDMDNYEGQSTGYEFWVWCPPGIITHKCRWQRHIITNDIAVGHAECKKFIKPVRTPKKLLVAIFITILLIT